jgi:hypothetical protein
MASISFTDGSGTVEISNTLTSVASRFQKWVPLVNPIGPLHHALGTGIPYQYEHRCDHGAKFVLPYIPNTVQSDCTRLLRHLLRAGSITVDTDDLTGNSYTCYLWPGSRPELSDPDPVTLERTLTLSVLNSDDDEVMECLY